MEREREVEWSGQKNALANVGSKFSVIAIVPVYQERREEVGRGRLEVKKGAGKGRDTVTGIRDGLRRIGGVG